MHDGDLAVSEARRADGSEAVLRVARPRSELRDGRLIVSAEVTRPDGPPRNLWFSVPEALAPHVAPDNADPFLLALLPAAMSRGEALVLEGTVSPRLLFNARRGLQDALLLLRHPLRRIAVSAGALAKPDQPAAGVATGFSGGVDSFATLMDHLIDPAPEAVRLTHLIFNQVGAVESAEFDSRFAVVKDVAAEFGLGVIDVRSNLAGSSQVPFILSHSLLNGACAALLPGLVGRLLYSSTYTIETVGPGVSDIAKLDPVVLPLISSERLSIAQAGVEYTRVAKTRLIADLPAARRHLNVCIARHTVPNCSRCEKCCRTMFALERLGKLEHFAEVFDLPRWRDERAGYVGAELLNWNRRRNAFSQDQRGLARETGYRYSLTEYALGAAASVLPEGPYRLAARLASALSLGAAQPRPAGDGAEARRA